MTPDIDSRETAADAVREYLRSDPERCMPTCRVGCPCDGGQQDYATGAPDAAQEIVDIVLSTMTDRLTEDERKAALRFLTHAPLAGPEDDAAEWKRQWHLIDTVREKLSPKESQ